MLRGIRLTLLSIATVLGLCLFLALPSFAVERGLSRQVVAEISLARKNPREYANYLKEFRGEFRGNAYLLPGKRAMVETREGVAAVDEAIRYLARQRPLPPLAWSARLAAAAGDLAGEEGASGAIGHHGRAAGGPVKRILRHGERPAAMGENIFYGRGDARLVVMSLIIDDGVPDRGHRKNIFSPAFTSAGAACGPHPRFGALCVIDFAGD
ncbi:MAG TPA: CAP domain-containing protein [Geobacteraceae bacterium]